MALQPVMSLTSRVVAVKGIRAGETVGYGARFTPDRPITLAVIPAGYADGLDRRLEGRGSVLIRGRRARLVGAVSMDMLTADVTDIAGVNPGDEVVFLGSQGDGPQQTLDAREMAARSFDDSLRNSLSSRRPRTPALPLSTLTTGNTKPRRTRRHTKS